MTDDIYRKRERVSNVQASQKSKPKRRRRTHSSHSGSSLKPRFDEHDRSRSKRRSKNSGFRRMTHLLKKETIQKRLGILFGVLLVLYIIFLAVWQFWYQDYCATKQLNEKRAATSKTQQQTER